MVTSLYEVAREEFMVICLERATERPRKAGWMLLHRPALSLGDVVGHRHNRRILPHSWSYTLDKSGSALCPSMLEFCVIFTQLSYTATIF